MNLSELEKIVERLARDPYANRNATGDTTFRTLHIKTHPDRWPGEEERAKRVFARVGELQSQASDPRHLEGYRLIGDPIRGDLSQVYLAADDDSGTYLRLKVPRVKAKGLIRREADRLKKLEGNHQLALTVPRLFSCDPDRYLATVDIPDHRTLKEVAESKNSRIAGEHIAWIFKRILMTLAYAHDHGVVHGAITPEHILLDTTNHGIALVGWLYGGKPGDEIKIVPARYKSLYPVTTTKSKRMTFDTDIAMAAKCCLDVSNEKLPWRIEAFLKSCSAQGIFCGIPALELHEDFAEIVNKSYGEPRFVHFT